MQLNILNIGDNMELRQLTYFKSIAEHGSINAAAKNLHMSQPPLSYAITQLEAELGVQLFERSAKGIRLTDAGKVFYEHANDILTRTNSAIREVSSITLKQTFRIGITPTVVPVIASYLCSLEKENGNILLELHEGNTYQLKESLDDGTLDAAVIRTPVNLQGCRYLKLMDEPMAAVYPSGRRAGTEIPLSSLSEKPLILYRRYEPLIREVFSRYSLAVNMICECDDARTAIRLAEEGLGTALVPRTIAMTRKGHACIINARELSTSIILVWHNSSPILTSLLELLK